MPEPSKPLLLLFDVDGTLFLTPDPLVGRAVVETLQEVYGVALPADAIDRVDHVGQTTKRIGRLVLEAAGLELLCRYRARDHQGHAPRS